MLVSVVVPTRNRAALVARALASLARQDAPRDNWEVVVVDNGSTDGTAAVVAGAQATLPRLRYAVEPRPGLHEARHLGLREAAGQVLAYIDDDVEVSPGWIGALLDAFSDAAVGLVGGSNRPRFAGTPPPWLARLWEQRRSIPSLSVLELDGAARDVDPALVWGCNFSIRRDALIEAGGFHPDAMPDTLAALRGDGEMPVGRHVAAQGRRCLFHPGASVLHFVPAERMTTQYFRRRAWLQGISDSYTDLRRAHQEGTTPASGAAPWRRAAARAIEALSDPTLGRLGWLMDRAYAQGRKFHAEAFATDAKVREWVLRPSYLDRACA